MFCSAGHQKKIMLAIDRLKKLKLAAKRSAQQNAEIFQASLQPSQQSSSVCDSHWSPSVMYHSPSKSCIAPPKSPYYLTPTDIYRRPGESSFAAQPRLVSAYQPEMVAIQVKRSTNVQSPAVYDVPAVSPGYESFHGVPVRDAGLSRVMSPYDDTSVVRMRRASGDSCVATPCSSSPYAMMTPQSCVGSGTAHLQSSRSSAPSTPLHITSRLTPSIATPKKIPPVPPQRTNSVKANNNPLPGDACSQLSSSQCTPANCGSLDRMSKNRQQCVKTTHNTIPCFSPTNASATVLSSSVETGSTGDCSTLPFANENIGTIRQRSTPTAHGVDNDDDVYDDKPAYDEYSGTVRRRGRRLDELTYSSVV